MEKARKSHKRLRAARELNRVVAEFYLEGHEAKAHGRKLEDIEREYILKVLKEVGGQKGKAAEKLIRKLLDSAFEAARKTGREDHLYTDLDVRGWKLWLGQNETGKYTLMFPEDY